MEREKKREGGGGGGADEGEGPGLSDSRRKVVCETGRQKSVVKLCCLVYFEKMSCRSSTVLLSSLLLFHLFPFCTRGKKLSDFIFHSLYDELTSVLSNPH